MRLIDNPFKLLDVTPSDNVNIINQNAEDKAFMDDDNEKIYEDARTTLLSPTKRIAAEVGWIYNRNIDSVINDINNGIVNLNNCDCLEKVNYLIEVLYKCELNKLYSVFVSLDRCYRESDNSNFSVKVLNRINSARQVAGIPVCDDASLIQNEIKLKLGEINSAINYLFGKLKDDDLIKITNLIAANTIEAGNEYGQVIDSLINQYAIHFSDDLTRKKELILSRIEGLKNIFSESGLYSFCEEVRIFDNEAQPIQLFLQKSGQSKIQVESNEVAHALRDFAIYLYDKGKIDGATTLINLGIEVFPELPDVFTALNEDRKILIALKSRQTEFAEIERMIEEGWKNIKCDSKYADQNRQYLTKHAPCIRNKLDELSNKYLTSSNSDNDQYIAACMNCAYFYNQLGDMISWGAYFIDALDVFAKSKLFAEKSGDTNTLEKVTHSISTLNNLITQIGRTNVPRLKAINSTNTSNYVDIPSNSSNQNKFSLKTIAVVAVVIFALYSMFSGQDNSNTRKTNVVNNKNRSISATTSNKVAQKQETNTNSSDSSEDRIDLNKSSDTKLPFETKLKGYITGTDVFMRSGPGKQYKGVGFFRKGEIVEILGTQMDWVKVRTANGSVVWVFNQYFAAYPVEMPSSEMSLGGIVLLNTTLRDVKSIYGEPSDKKVYEGDGAHVVTYYYGSLFKVYGRTGIPKNKSLMIVENNIPVIGYSIETNNLATQSGIRVGMPYQKVVDLYGLGRIYTTKDKKIISFFYSNKQLQTISFYVDGKGIIKEISVGQDW